MGSRHRVSDPRLLIIGLGPAGLDRLSVRALTLLDAPDRVVIARTAHHPAVNELGARREVTTCDDIYDAAAGFDEVYQAIADRVLLAADSGPVAYAVPGSAVVGERAVAEIRRRAEAANLSVEIVPGESFLDLIYAAAKLDPIVRPVKILDGRDMPDPLVFDAALIITQVDRREVLAEVVAGLGRVLDDSTQVLVLDRLGDPDEVVQSVELAELSSYEPGARTSLFLDPEPAGWYGLVLVNRLLRQECPWDRKQTHHSLLSHLIEEAYETVLSLIHI